MGIDTINSLLAFTLDLVTANPFASEAFNARSEISYMRCVAAFAHKKGTMTSVVGRVALIKYFTPYVLAQQTTIILELSMLVKPWYISNTPILIVLNQGTI
jgi:hypothetical protein